MNGPSAVALGALIRGLWGEWPGRADWMTVIDIANRSWLTPALFAALSRALLIDRLPDDVHDYLALIHGRNQERNRRLTVQMEEAVRALNARGIRPTLLKGAVGLFAATPDAPCRRMMSDLDLMVEHDKRDAAEACLADLGYRCFAELGTPGFGRVQDVGVVELHVGSGGGVAGRLPSAFHALRPVRRGDLRASVQSPTLRALHLILHDQIKEGDYWRGLIDLRHLHDLAELARSPDGVDWDALHAAMPDRLSRNALETQLLTAHRLFGVSIPPRFGRRLVPRVQHLRRMLQLHYPIAAMPLRFAGDLAWVTRRVRVADVPGWMGQGPWRPQAARIVRKLLQGPQQTYMALIGLHKGPKL